MQATHSGADQMRITNNSKNRFSWHKINKKIHKSDQAAQVAFKIIQNMRINTDLTIKNLQHEREKKYSL